MQRINPRTLTVLALGVSLVMSFALFGNGITGDFVFDDKIVIVGHPLIGNGFPNLIQIFGDSYHSLQPRTGLYRPLTITSYALNYYFFGQSPVSFHVVNVILHALTGFLLFLAVRRIASLEIATTASLLFLAFPIHVEDVTSIVGRAEILAFLFSLLALYCAIRGKLILSAAAFLLGLFSKESAIALLPIWLAWEYFFQNISIRALVKKTLFFLPALLAYGALRYIALGQYFLSNDATAIYNPLKFTSFFDTMWTSGAVLTLYLQKLFIPLHFSSDYSFNAIPVVHNPLGSVSSLVGIVLLLGLCALAFRKRRELVGWSALWFLAYYFVISNLIFKTGTIMAERLLYAASGGLAILAAWAIVWLASHVRRTIVYGVLGVVLVWYGYAIIVRNRDWRTEERLFASAVAAEPDSVVNQTNLAYLTYLRDDYQGAKDQMDRVLAVAPDHVPALNLAAQSNKKLGNANIAEEYWKRAIELRSDYLRGYLGLGVLYYENGYFGSAEQALTDAVNIYPRWSEVLFLSLTKTALKKYDEAIEVVIRHFGENPERADLKFALGVAYYKKGDREQALTYLRQVRNPNMTQEEFLKTIEKNTIFLITDL